MALSGTHEIVDRWWVGQARGTRKQSRLAVFAHASAIPLFSLGGVTVNIVVTGGWAPPAPLLLGFGLAAGIYMLLLATLMLRGRLLYRNPVVDFDAATVTIGPDVTPFTEINRAWMIETEERKGTDIHFFIGGTGHRIARVLLRSAAGALISNENRNTLSELVERSNVEMPDLPTDRWDPKRKFVASGEARFLTKKQAIEVLSRAPASGDVVRD